MNFARRFKMSASFAQKLSDGRLMTAGIKAHAKELAGVSLGAEAAAEIGEFGVVILPETRHHRLERHAAFRAGARPDLADLGMHRAGVFGTRLRCRLR